MERSRNPIMPRSYAVASDPLTRIGLLKTATAQFGSTTAAHITSASTAGDRFRPKSTTIA